MGRNVSEFIWDYLYDYGVRHVFTLAGGGSMYLVDALARSRIKPIYMLHEQACAIAADAYAQYTDKLGVCLVTTGPGGTNAITGVVASYIDSVPVLVISGQVGTKYFNENLRQAGPQGFDIVSIAKKFTKIAQVQYIPQHIEGELSALIREATTPRKGPVWLDIPLDVQQSSL